MRKITLRQVPLGIFKHAIFIFWSVITIYPVLFMIINSLKTQEEYSINHFGLPINVTFVNLKEILVQTPFLRWFLNSTIITVSSILLSLVLSILAAYGISRYSFKFKGILINLLIGLIMIPPIIMIIPLFVFMKKVGLANTYYGTVLIYTTFLIPFSIYLLLNFFKTIPDSLIESAHIDGASSIKILTSIVIPFSAPAIGILAVINTIWVWNDLLIAIIFMQKESMLTLIGGLSQFASKYVLKIPLLMTGLTLASIPIIILYFFTAKYFVKGFSTGAFKE